MEELEQQAKKRAVQKLAQKLASKEDLDKIANLRAMLQKKVATIESQVRSGLHETLSHAQDALEKLEFCRDSVVVRIRENFLAINRACTGDPHLEALPNEHYELIQQVNTARCNLRRTRQTLLYIMRIPTKVKQIKELIREPTQLLRTHREVRKLERMKADALHRARNLPTEFKALERKFAECDELVRMFEDRLWAVFRDCREVALKTPKVVEMAVKIVEIEEKADVRAIKRHERGKKPSTKEFASSDGGTEPLDNSPASSPRGEVEQPIRGYLGQCFEEIRKGIAERFERMFGGLGARYDDDMEAVLDNLDALVDDLKDIQHAVVPCFPQKYNIYQFFAVEYHRQLDKLFGRFAADADKVAHKAVLQLVAWEGFYRDQMKQLGLSAETAQPSLLETLRPATRVYCGRMRALFTKWTDQIIVQELDPKSGSLKQLDNGLWISDGVDTLFKFLTDQISIIKETHWPDLIVEIAEECAGILLEFQEKMQKILETRWRELEFEFLMSQVNCSSQGYDHLQMMSETLQELLPEEERSRITLDNVFEGFHRLSGVATAAIVNVMFECFETPLNSGEDGESSKDNRTVWKLFYTREWAEGKSEAGQAIDTICETLREYFEQDIDGRILDPFFRKLTAECLERVATRLLDELVQFALGKEKDRAKVPIDKAFVDKMEADEKELKEFFVGRGYVREKQVELKLQSLRDVRQLCSVGEPEMVCIYYGSLHFRHPNVITVPVMKGLIDRRADFTDQQKDQAVKAIKSMAEKEKEQVLSSALNFALRKASAASQGDERQSGGSDKKKANEK